MVDRAIGILTAIIGLAALAVIVSKRAQTANVLTALLSGLSKTIQSAVSPVTK